MNPSLYPGQDHEVTDLAKRIDTNVDAKVSADELKNFLEAKDITPDKNKLLQVLSSKESELRKISGLESSVRSLVDSLVSKDILKKPFDKVVLTESQKAAILLNEGLYGGKSLSGEQAVSSEAIKTDNKDQKVDSKKTPELNQDLWDKYTLKRAISNVSGLPTSYTVNLDEIKLSDDKKSATITLYMAEKGVLINKEVKDNVNNNDSQTTIKFERQADGSRGLSHNKEDKDTTLIRLQDGSQIVRLPQPDGSVQDFKVSLGNNLQLQPHIPNQEYFNKIDGGKGIGAFGTGVKLSKMRTYVDKEHGSAYYIADLTFNNKSLGQQILFDQNGKPLNGKKYWIKTPGMPGQVYETTDSEKNFYVNKLQDTNTKPNDVTKVTESKNYEIKVIDTQIKSVDLDKSLLDAGYVVDHVPGESVYHIAQKDLKNGGKLDSKLTISQSELTKLNKGEILPIYLKDVGKYYNLKSIDGKISLQEDKTIEDKKNKISENLKKTLELGRKNRLGKERFARYGGLQSGPVISNVEYVGPKEDMYLDEKARKQDKLLFQAVLGLPNSSQNPKIKTATVLMEGNQLQGMPEDYKPSSNFVKSNQEITVETNDILKTYLVGMKDGHIAFEEKYIVKSGATEQDKTKIEQEEKNAFKQFIESYHNIDGKKMFEGKPFTELKNNKGEFVGYLVNTTQQGSSETYTAFDMKGNIISQLPPDAKTDDNKNLAKLSLDSSYEVKNKNERVIGLTQAGDNIKELSEKIGSAPEKIKKAIEAGGFQQKNKIDRKNDSGQIIGFILDVSKIDITKTPVTKKSKEKTSSVENTYKVYFDLNGNIDNTKSVYKLHTDGSPQITEQMKAEVVGEKLYITKPESLQKAKEDQKASDKRKELLQGYPKEGKVRIEKDNKIYEISTTDTKEFAYTKLNDPLAKQQGQYDKDFKYIKDTYVYKDQNLGSYEKTPFYTQLKDLRDADPASFNEHTINELIAQEKTTKQKQLKPLTSEEQSQLQSKVDEFIKDSNNFKEYTITKDNAKEIAINGTTSSSETQKKSDTPVQLEKKPEVVTINGKETIFNTPVIKATADTQDITPKWTKDSEGNFINPIKTPDGKQIQVIVDKNGGTITTDKPNEYTVQKNPDKTISVMKKPIEKSTANQNNTPIITPEKNISIPESKESREILPNFRWSKYINNPPALNFVTEQGQIADKNWFTKEQANQDRTNDFGQLVKFVREYSGNNAALKELQSSIINKNATDIIEKVQDWSLDHGCNCKDDNNTLKLNDNKLGINTYAALLCTLQKEGAPQGSIVDTQRQQFRKILTPTIVASIENKNNYENIA